MLSNPTAPASLDLGALLAQPRDFVGNHFVYAVITSRARGLSIGVNMNPDQRCNFDCPYCEVRRLAAKAHAQLDLGVMSRELMHLVAMARSGQLSELEQFAKAPSDVLELREVALSGDGEPSMVENFDEAVAEVLRVRQLLGHFKVVLITNGTGLHRPAVERGLARFELTDEIWIKLDAGNSRFMKRINGTEVPIEAVHGNILNLGRLRPVVIQSLFCEFEGHSPGEEEIDAYINRLTRLKAEGAQISMVQIYSVARKPARPGCKHLPLAALSKIARRVRSEASLNAEVF
jgi:wyosine [tRNA(Phe)-imidazoG37] synthetase (radical SAM superfamily)